MKDLRIALLASCNTDFLRPRLAVALSGRGLLNSVWVGGFGQYRQNLLDTQSDLYRHDPEVVILYSDEAHIFCELLENPFAYTAETRRQLAEARVAEIRQMAEVLVARLPDVTLLINTPVVEPRNALLGLEYNSEFGLQDAVAAYNNGLSALANSVSNIAVVDVASLAAQVGYDSWRDSRMWYLARSPFSRKALDILAEHYTATIAGRLGRIPKCIVLDLDNTLWGGVAGEDGLEGLRLGEDGIGRAFVDFQLELLNLSRKGVLLAICSKNNPEDALSVIRHHPAMRLRENHFAAMRINWEDKASNLRSLADELNIGLDSLVFLDDNAAERAWVRKAAIEVMVPDWPEDPGEYKNALLELSARHFVKPGLTAEDRIRTVTYRTQAARRNLESSATSLTEFYAALNMRVRVGLADRFSIPRIAQLTQKTNQFNLTTRRYTQAQIDVLSADPQYAIWWLELSDRFGASGLVGVLILRNGAENVWTIDTFLLSCRVMGRTVENAFLAVVAREVGAAKLIGEFHPSAKNSPVQNLYSGMGFGLLQEEAGSTFWQLDLADRALPIPAWFEVEVASHSLHSEAMV